MAKDPAFLFYPGDWLGGTQWMTHEQKGCYMDLLILQFNTGKFTEEQAKQVLSICFDVAWPILKQKFENGDGFYYNKRLREEIEKRKKFTESRRLNGLNPKSKPEVKPKKHRVSHKHMLKHMENENEIINNSFMFYKDQVEKAKKYNDLMSKSYVDLCRQLCKKQNEEWVMKDILTIKSQLTLDEYSKLYAKSNNNPDSIFEKISSLQTNIDYHGKYENIYLTINKWLTPKK